MPILIIDNYDSFTFNLYQMMQEQTDIEVLVQRNDKIDLSQIKALKPQSIVLSPGPGHPAEPRDFGVCATVLENAGTIGCPILGVCLGHQGIAQHFGGRVSRAPEIVHGKTSSVDIVAKSPLFEGLPPTFTAMRYHSLIVEQTNFPDCLQVTATEPSAHLVMALQHKSLPVYGVQFHPESIGTPDGKLMLRNFISLC